MARLGEGGRPVGMWELLALGVNGIVGVGIFFAPAVVAESAPSLAAVVVFALTGLALVPVALAFATLGGRFDEDGGPVVFARAAFGDGASFLVGWVAYVSAFFSAAAVVVGLTRAVAPLAGISGPVGLRLTATAVVTILALVVGAGIAVSARAWTALTALKLVPLLLLLAVAVSHQGALPPAELGAPQASWLRAGLTVMFAYQGFEIVPVIAGQVRSHGRNIPAATIGSLVLAVGLYVALVWACVVALPGLSGRAAPLAEAAGVYGGSWLARTVEAGTSVSALGIAFGMMVTTPRYLSALAGGRSDPWRLSRVTGKGVPLRALVVTWIFVVLVVNLGELAELFVLSSIAVLMQYGVTAAALVALSLRRERGLGPHHAWPALPAIALGVLLVAFGATLREVLVTLGVILSGLLLLWLSRRKGAPRQGGGDPC